MAIGVELSGKSWSMDIKVWVTLTASIELRLIDEQGWLAWYLACEVGITFFLKKKKQKSW